jgi:hypothetical protein
MTWGQRSGKDAVDGRDSNYRAVRLALLQTLRDLRRSVAAGRPMTLPNCLRLCQRRLAGRRDSAVLELLTAIYRQDQPFRRGWRCSELTDNLKRDGRMTTNERLHKLVWE